MVNRVRILIGVLCLSMTGNIILTGLNFLPHESKLVNIKDFPINYTCLLDTQRHLIKNHIYAHSCYNKWLDTSIIDLRFMKDGFVNLTNYEIIL